MDKPYVSSLISHYGDAGSVKHDVETLNEILDRQGTSLFIDVIAEHVGRIALDFKSSPQDVKRVTDSLVSQLREAIGERT